MDPTYIWAHNTKLQYFCKELITETQREVGSVLEKQVKGFFKFIVER